MKQDQVQIFAKRILRDFYKQERYPELKEQVQEAIDELSYDEFLHLKYAYMLGYSIVYESNEFNESEPTVKRNNRKALDRFVSEFGRRNIFLNEIKTNDKIRYRSSKW